MTVFYSTESQLQANSPREFPNAAIAGGRVRRYRNTITLASQTTADTIQLTEIPAGSVFAFGVITSTVSLGSSTVAVGITGTTAKYKAAAAFTATDTPTFFGNVSAMDDVILTANEVPIITIGAATLPSSGTLMLDLYFAAN